MITIRVASPADIPAITSLGLEALQSDPFEGLVISPEKVEEMARECVSSATNFSWVAEEDGEVVGAVSALVHPMMFYERKQATVVQFYTRRNGAGIKLIREFLGWARGRRVIKMICFTLECNADPRIGKLLKRLGLNEALPVYMELR